MKNSSIIEIFDVLELKFKNNKYTIKRNSKNLYLILDKDEIYIGYIFFNKENFLLNSPIKNFNCVMEFKTFFEAFEFLIEKIEGN